MIEAMDMPKMPKPQPVAASAPQPEKRGRGRPKVLSDDQTERVVYRAPAAEYDQLAKLAKSKGYVYQGEGSPGPLLLKITLAYLTQPSVRQVIDASRAAPPAPKRGATPNLEYRNFLRCTPAEREAIESESLAQGNVRAGKGNPAPLIRKVMHRYLHDATVRLAVDAVLEHQHGGTS